MQYGYSTAALTEPGVNASPSLETSSLHSQSLSYSHSSQTAFSPKATPTRTMTATSTPLMLVNPGPHDSSLPFLPRQSTPSNLSFPMLKYIYLTLPFVPSMILFPFLTCSIFSATLRRQSRQVVLNRMTRRRLSRRPTRKGARLCRLNRWLEMHATCSRTARVSSC